MERQREQAHESWSFLFAYALKEAEFFWKARNGGLGGLGLWEGVVGLGSFHAIIEL